MVYELSQQMLEDHPQQVKRPSDQVIEADHNSHVLEFSHGPMPMQMFDQQPHMSPLLV